MTLAQMRTQVRSVIDIDSTDINDTTLNNMIGQGFDTMVYSEKRWSFYEVSTTFNTVGSTKDYSLATIAAAPDAITQGLREIVSIRNDDHVLQYVGRDGADWDYPLNVSTSGDPWEWSFWNDTVRLYPTPSAAETIYVRGVRFPTDFGVGSADGDTPDLPEAFHAVLCTYAIARAYLQQEDPVMAQQYQTQFAIELDNVARRYVDTHAPQPMVANSRKPPSYMAGFCALRYANTGGVIW